jgi:hypothetical protein
MVLVSIPRLHHALAIGHEHAHSDAIEIVRQHTVVV